MGVFFRSTVRVFLFAALAASTFAPRVAQACSVCRCGDATFGALGTNGYAKQGFRLALDWERFDKDEGDPAVEVESLVEQRFTTMVSYGFSDRAALFARIPVSVRDQTSGAAGEAAEETHTSGFSDPEVYGQYRVWGSAFRSGLGQQSALSLNAGIKLPWGRNNVVKDGVRVDEHAQPGTGSTDLFTSLSYLHLLDKNSSIFASIGYRHTGENDFGYHYGSAFLANVAYEHKLNRALDGVVELNFRNAAKDRVDAEGTLDDDTGGALLYLTPRLLVDLKGGFVLRIAVQIPIVRDLNGFQKERPVVNVGITYLFSH
jgi:hypothetical protein